MKMKAMLQVVLMLASLTATSGLQCNIDAVLECSSLDMSHASVTYLPHASQDDCTQACCDNEACSAAVFDSSNGDCLLSDCTFSTCDIEDDDNKTVTYVGDRTSTMTPGQTISSPQSITSVASKSTTSSTSLSTTVSIDIVNTVATTDSVKDKIPDQDNDPTSDHVSNITQAPIANTAGSVKGPESNDKAVVPDDDKTSATDSGITELPTSAVPPQTPSSVNTESITSVTSLPTEGRLNQTLSASTEPEASMSLSTKTATVTSSVYTMTTSSVTENSTEKLGLKHLQQPERENKSNAIKIGASSDDNKSTTTVNDINITSEISPNAGKRSTESPEVVTNTPTVDAAVDLDESITSASQVPQNTTPRDITAISTTNESKLSDSTSAFKTSIVDSDSKTDSTSPPNIPTSETKSPSATPPLSVTSSKTTLISNWLVSTLLQPPVSTASPNSRTVTNTRLQAASSIHASATKSSKTSSPHASTSSPHNLPSNNDTQEAVIPNYNTSSAANQWTGRMVSPDELSVGIIVILSLGIFFTAVVMVIIGKRLFDGWQRRHYNRMDYLINGIYN